MKKTKHFIENFHQYLIEILYLLLLVVSIYIIESFIHTNENLFHYFADILIYETWNGNKDYLKGAILFALGSFLSKYGESFDDSIFKEKFQTVSYAEIVIEAKSYSMGNRIDYLRAFYNIFNRKGKKLAASFKGKITNFKDENTNSLITK